MDRDRMLEVIREMEQEKKELALFYDEGIDDVLNVIVGYLDKSFSVSTFDFMYPTEELPFTEKQFDDVFMFFDQYASDHSMTYYDEDAEGLFHAHKYVFEYNGKLYEGSMEVGQGTVLSMTRIDKLDDSFDGCVMRDVELIKLFWSSY